MTSQRARIEQEVQQMRAQSVDPPAGPPWLERVVSMSSDKYEDPQADLDQLASLLERRFPGLATQREGHYPTYTLSARIPAGVSLEDVRRFAQDWVYVEGRTRAGSAPYQPKYGHGPDEYQSGYRYALEAARHERRADARATLEQLLSGSKTDFIRGQIAAYREHLGETPSAADLAGSHVKQVAGRWQPVATSGVVLRDTTHNTDGTGYQTRRGALDALREMREMHPGVSAGKTRRPDVKVDTSSYRGSHGAEPRGRANWTFVIGKRTYSTSDDPAIYRPAQARGVASLSYAEARKHAVAEAVRRGVSLVGVAP